ncbi:MAG: hypothetical protein NVS1B11_02460 [Terriglobales bacterium]
MKRPSRNCALCGEIRTSGKNWYLLAENQWENRLQIFGWSDLLAGREDLFCACGPNHVRELVVHWMTTGRLDYPFARVSASRPPVFRERIQSHNNKQTNPREYSARALGELSVHRESIGRVLDESPLLPNTILQELAEALLANTTPCGVPQLE